MRKRHKASEETKEIKKSRFLQSRKALNKTPRAGQCRGDRKTKKKEEKIPKM